MKGSFGRATYIGSSASPTNIVDTPASMTLPRVRPSVMPMRKAERRTEDVYSPSALYAGWVSEWHERDDGVVHCGRQRKRFPGVAAEGRVVIGEGKEGGIRTPKVEEGEQGTDESVDVCAPHDDCPDHEPSPFAPLHHPASGERGGGELRTDTDERVVDECVDPSVAHEAPGVLGRGELTRQHSSEGRVEGTHICFAVERCVASAVHRS
jgi:hypothetical protein